MDYEKISADLIDMAVLYGPKLIGAILVWIIGSWIIKGLQMAFTKMLEKAGVDNSLRPFIQGIIGALLKILLIITVLSMIGIEMTSFIAILGAAGLAVGMALSGTLQNFAGGVMILLFKPFKVGDVIDAQGYTGKVSEIQIFNTILKTPDNKTIIIPNGGLATSSMTNFSTEPKRRVDWTFGIAYGDDTEKAKQVMKALCDADDRILKDPEVFIAVSALADSSVNFVVRAWVNAENYWGVYFDMNENIYNTFNKEGLNIPFPQMDVHMHKSD
ncbi:mechanosensitive ion channel family protein [Thalassotalea aquiviva]|uniref:mechanosensitive ion channel family protein n=1 Tax=Thalassotalea aquiviva TaxID=3242415 RepID=UPI00352AAD22